MKCKNKKHEGNYTKAHKQLLKTSENLKTTRGKKASEVKEVQRGTKTRKH